MNPVSAEAAVRGMSDPEKFSDISFGGSAAQSAHLHLAIKRRAAQDLKDCPRSREQVADVLSAMLGRRITLAQIDAITAETKEHRFPAEWIPAWTVATGSRQIVELLCAEIGCWVGDSTDRRLADYGRGVLAAEKQRQRLGELKSELWDKVPL